MFGVTIFKSKLYFQASHRWQKGRWYSFIEWDTWFKTRCTISLHRAFLENKGLWNEEAETTAKKSVMKDIMAAFGRAEKAKKPPISDMFTDVYDEKPERLQKQYDELLEHIKKYPDHYPTGHFQA